MHIYIAGFIRSTSLFCTHLKSLITFILQMGKLKFREARTLAPSLTDSKR